ncbi:DUF4282 domain-containing protein [Flavitalea sp. BT771]|uniref:DUF4282 domain-containing protein n=1 Tax=Flavitalea sp. BT771 TaxID=3063329 RepID=UPI0026E322E3|nr:DUF4282 domain-containing protein [Flavitalea sp. BT771]MDO6429201.1 DUF4282 domain-containing protein [Flavitalea sp. BT771]MDV6218671.1 DUF4282 domain-containing protein [Flavitalea sp. BT771]
MEQTNIAPATGANPGFNWRDFLSFRTMITLQIIQIVYVVVAVLITLASLAAMFSGSRSRGGFEEFGGGGLSPFSLLGGGGFIGGLIMLIVGNVAWRIWCELIIIFFRINKTLNNIEINTRI